MIQKNYTIVTDEIKLEEMKAHISAFSTFAFDTETTGLNVRKDKIIGLSICGLVGTAFYLPLLTWDKTMQRLVSVWHRGTFSEILELLKSKELLMWNGSFDVQITKNDFSIDLGPSLLADIMLMKHTVDEEGDFALKDVAVSLQNELGMDSEEVANQEQLELKENVITNGGEWTKANKQMFMADLEVLGKYACADADLTLRLAEYYRQKLIDENLEEFYYDKEVMPLYREVTIGMEEKGVHLNMPLILATKEEIVTEMAIMEKDIREEILSTDAAKSWIKAKALEDFPPKPRGKFGTKLCEMFEVTLPRAPSGGFSFTEKALSELPDSFVKNFLLGIAELPSYAVEDVSMTLYEASGETLNINSKHQLKAIVFDHMGIKALSQTKKGADQFDDDTIQHLADNHDISWAKKLSSYNKLVKILGTYIERFLERQEDGIFYFQYKQHGTISGRFSGDAQQMPRPKEEEEMDPLVIKYNNKIRAFFIPKPGHVFIDSDYESLEPHCVAKDSKVFIYGKGIVEINKVIVGDRILSAGGFQRINKVWNSNKRQLSIVTKKGVVRCSPDHKIWVKQRGWTLASNIKKGDILSEHKFDYDNYENAVLPVYLKKAKVPFAFTELTTDLAWALGAFLGDGVFCTTSSKYVGICGLAKDGVTSVFAKILESIGAIPKRYDDFRTEDMESYRCHDSWLVDIFKQTFDLAGDVGKKLHIPDYIINSSREIRLSFLAGLIDTDGTYGKTKRELSISTKSPKLASDICSLGNTLGLDGRINLAHSGKHKMYQVRFTAVSTNKMLSEDFNSYLVCKRKQLRPANVGKIKSPEAVVLEVNSSGSVEMVDISVENNHEFICDNIRVHNCFAHVSGDERIKDIFRKGHDFYSTIAIITEKLLNVSADKKAENYLGKINKIKRQNAKPYALGIPYGMEEFLLARTLGIPTAQAKELLDGYLTGFPDLAQWMKYSEFQAKLHGFVRSEAGRIRHLPKVKELYARHGDKLKDFKYRNQLIKKHDKDAVTTAYRDYKNGLNNSKNFQVQSLASSIVNAASIAINREFKQKQIDGFVCANIHDQIIASVAETQAEKAKEIMERLMKTTTKLSVELKAPPSLAYNWRDGH